jgi:hypothetical protein
MKPNRISLIILIILIANIFIVYYGRENYPANWSPDSNGNEVSFLENYLILLIFELGCIFIPTFFILLILVLILTTHEIFKEFYQPISFLFTIIKEFFTKQLKQKTNDRHAQNN